jgi:DNA mismatch repair protein MSH2
MASRPELKLEDESGFIKFFRSLPDPGSETLRIFDRNDFYTAHGADAVFIAKAVCGFEAFVRNRN